MKISLLFAVIAAFFNALGGVFTKILLIQGLNSNNIAFLKSFLGFLILLFVFKWKKESLFYNLKLAVCALFGIFFLFFFETNAFKYGIAANVTFILMLTASISSFVLSMILLKDKITIIHWFGLLITLFGLYLFMYNSNDINLKNILFSIAAGFGYGAFSVLIKLFNINVSLITVQRFLFFGSIYLILPTQKLNRIITEGNIYVYIVLFLLAIIPAIGGFYFTMKAIELSSPKQVQVFELLEPIFLSILAFIIFHEIPSNLSIIGAIIILLGLYVFQSNDSDLGLNRKKFFKSTRK